MTSAKTFPDSTDLWKNESACLPVQRYQAWSLRGCGGTSGAVSLTWFSTLVVSVLTQKAGKHGFVWLEICCKSGSHMLGHFHLFFGGWGGVSYKRRFFSTHVHFSCFAYGCVCKSSPCVAASISNVQTNFGRVTELKLGAGRHFKVVGQRTTKNLLWGKKPIEWLATVLFLLIVQNKYKNIVHSAVYYYYSFVV